MMAQQVARFCAVCGCGAAPRALFCVECGARLASVARFARPPRPSGARLGGRYRLRRLISIGGNGAVYEAQHELLGTIHAVKETLATDPESLEQFLTEARLLARLAHPMLVRVTDYFIEPPGSAFLVMDYAPGETLQHKLEQPAPGYTVQDAIGWILQLCAALEYLHSYRDPVTGHPRPIIHRDIKPLNVILTPDGQIKLLDLGIARASLPGQATARVARSVSEPFAPIEQYGAGTDARSDLYALGVTAYALLTRQLPPSAPERIAQPRRLSIHSLNRQVPPGVAAVIERAMMPRPEDRYPSVVAFRCALELEWHTASQAARPSGRDTSSLWALLQRALGGANAGAASGEALLHNGVLAEQIVVWRAHQGQRASIEVALVVERSSREPPHLRLMARIAEYGPRGRATQQQIVLEAQDARAFAASVDELLHLHERMAAEIHFAADRTSLHGAWPGARGPLELTIRRRGPRGGVKACTILLDRRQVAALAQELRRGLRRCPA